MYGRFRSLFNSRLMFFLPIAVPKIQLGPSSSRIRSNNETNFAETEVEELIAMLRETESPEEQGDILQYLVDTQGLDYNTGKIFKMK